ncbi:hypothetical protein LEMLEM_LOCUS12687, partial [Lemmus lemmus]
RTQALSTAVTVQVCTSTSAGCSASGLMLRFFDPLGVEFCAR